MATEVDYGSDFSCESDLDANLSVVTGQLCLVQALVRRLQTSSLFYDPTYGEDLRGFVNGTYSAYEIARAAEVECLKDERVERVRSSSELDETTAKLTLVVTTGLGSFRMVVSVSSLTVELLDFVEL